MGVARDILNTVPVLAVAADLSLRTGAFRLTLPKELLRWIEARLRKIMAQQMEPTGSQPLPSQRQGLPLEQAVYQP